MNYTTTTEQETKAIAAKLSPSLTGGTILCLHGDLGAGKTTFVKGLAEGLGIKDTILSPTFTLMNIYNIKTLKHKNIKTLVHLDTYRLKDHFELLGIGVTDYLGQPDTISIVEWPEKIRTLLTDKKIINIYFEHKTGNERVIKIET